MKKYPDLFLLKRKTAFVTGGIGLIGKEIIKAFAQAGGKTIILDVDDEKGKEMQNKMRKNGYQVHYERFDITDLSNIGPAIADLHKKYQEIDVWVNAAYPRTADWNKDLAEIPLSSWQKNVDMHMNTYCWISQKICFLMKKKGGSLINFGSIYGVLGNDPNIYKNTKITSPAAYTAIKGGIINFTRYLASYFGKYNVRVNNICPGGIYNHQDKIFISNYSLKTPLGRMAKAEEVAAAVLFLATDAASYITGATLMVDGGWSII